MKQEINLSESTPFIILCVIVASLSANSLGAFHLRTHMWGFSICFVVSIGKRSQNWGTLQHWDMLLEAAFPSGNPLASSLRAGTSPGCVTEVSSLQRGEEMASPSVLGETSLPWAWL